MCKADQYNLLKQSDIGLFNNMRMMCASLAWGSMSAVVSSLVDKFQSSGRCGYGIGKDEYTNPVLTHNVKEHDSTKVFLNTVIKSLNKELKKKDGKIMGIDKIDMKPRSRPIFNRPRDYIYGLKIAINDTCGYKVMLTEYESTGETTYKGKLKITIYDHFGLDKKDIELPDKPAGMGAGFRAWFILQHIRGYKPFITRMEFDHAFNSDWSKPNEI
jgi:hypothetical protein